MAYYKTSGKLTKDGIKHIDKLLANPMVNDYHKTLLKAIKSRPKNISKADADVLQVISEQYR